MLTEGEPSLRHKLHQMQVTSAFSLFSAKVLLLITYLQYSSVHSEDLKVLLPLSSIDVFGSGAHLS